MIKKILLGATCCISITTYLWMVGVPTPLNYRDTTQGIPVKKLLKKQCQNLNLDGLDTLNISGSAFLQKKHLIKHLSNKKYKTTVFNLAFENQDEFYLNGHNLRHYYGIALKQKPKRTKLVKKDFFRNMRYEVRKKLNHISNLDNIAYINEKEMIEQYPQSHYLQILPPEWLSDLTYMDQVIDFFDNTTPDTHIYFHCNHGRGRTTTFMLLYDIYRNYNTQTLENMITRQHCLDGLDISNTSPKPGGTWKPEALIARKNLVTYFYEYMNDPKGYKHQPWSAWLNANDIHPNPELATYKK